MTIARRLGVCLLATLGASAPAMKALAKPPAQLRALDRADLEPFLDGLVTGRMKAFRVVGVTVSVVNGGRMIFAKGYGYDDFEAQRPVEADRSLFRPGSISKTLTWTAVMQLYEQGKLELDADVQTYLGDLAIPRTFPQPITLLDLMAHAAGFEDSAVGHLFGGDPARVLPLAEYLRTHAPARVRPPATLPAYSNYGTALAGQIVANVSGVPFEDYVDAHILQPLGMSNTTFREPWGAQRPGPMPERLQTNVSKGYLQKDGGFESAGFEFVGQIGPAGALSTTATDMAKWMLVHLGDGAYGGAVILRPETARLMHTRHFPPDPDVDGMAHGWILGRVHGYRAYGHSGGTICFFSDLVVIPELGFGMFISTNTAGGGQLLRDLSRLVVSRYFPPGTEAPPAQPPEDFATRAGRFEGTYIPTRRAFTTLEKILNPTLAQVEATDDGYLVVHSFLGDIRFVEVAPLVFRATDSDAVLKFLEDGSGDVSGFYPGVAIMVMEKVGPLTNPRHRYAFMGLAALVFVGAWVAAWLRRGRPLEQSRGERIANAIVLVTAGLWVLGLGVALVGLLPLAEDFRRVFYGFPPPLLVVGLTLGLVAALATLASTALLYPVWVGGRWPLGRRLRHTGVVLIALALLLVLNDGNAIGYRYF